MRHLAAAAIAACVLGASPALAQDSLAVTIKSLVPGTPVAASVNGTAIGQTTANGTANDKGVMDLVLKLANLPKINGTAAAAQMSVWVEDCSTNPSTMRVFVIDVNSEPPPDNCRNRKRIGVIWWGKAKRITIDRDTLSTGGRLALSRNQWILVGGGAGALVLVGTQVGGDDDKNTTTPGGGGGGGSTTPTTIVTNGTYIVVFTVSSDPNGHAPFALYQLITQLLINGTGSTATITGNNTWQTLTASVSNGVLTFDGTGNVAGRTGVRIRGTLTVTTSGAISGTVTIGEPPAGSTTPGLPNGPIVYNVSGQRAN